MYSVPQLRLLARAYLAATGETASRLGKQICGNDKFIKGILANRDCKAKNAEQASAWFRSHWPHRAPWPAEVPRRPVGSPRVRLKENV